MKTICFLLWSGATAAVLSLASIGSGAQDFVPAHKSNTMYITIAMEKKQVHAGESPKVVLTIENLTDHAFPVNFCPPDRFWVQGERGEPPTTYLERVETQRWLPGERDLACGPGPAELLNPGGTSKSSWALSIFYDLSAPGKYSVYVDIWSTEGYLRTDPVEFEVLATDSVPKKDSQ